MKINWLAILIIALLLSFDSKAMVVSIVPENPVEGQTVQLNYVGCEPPFPNIDSGEYFYTNQDGNLIQFIGFYTFSLPTCPIISERTYDLGIFSEGNYQVEVYLFSADFTLPIDLSIFPPNELLNFGVSRPVSVPANSWVGLIFFILLIILIAFKQRMADI